MADIPDLTTTDPHLMLSVGRRHLAVRDYPSAVETLGRACELLGQMFGLQSDECGEAYLWYGKSLLGLAREESGVLGDGIPQGGEDSPDDKDDDGEAVDEDNNEDGDENGDEEKSDTEKGEEKDEEMEVEKEKPTKSEEKSAKDGVKPTEGEAEKPATDEKEESDKAAEGGEKSEAAGSSKKEPGAEPQDSDEEDDVESLQLAWEILELAKDIFLRRGEDGRKDLADVYLQLGEVSLESETYDKAISDMGKSLELFKELYSADDRRIAETHYQIGLAHSLSNGFEDAITHFRTAAEILQARIVNLESPGAEDDPNVKKYLATDPFYSISGETKELRELLPQIQEKIQDMMDYKAEAIKSVRESLGLSTNGQSDGKPTSATNGSDAAEAKPEEKKAVDISHLVKRKRKPSEENKMEAPSAKKPAN